MSFLSFGNTKLPKSTAIFNFSTATDCPSKRKGLCNHPKACYALKAERQYPSNIPYKESQRALFNLLSGEQLGKLFLLECNRKKNKIKFFRFSEAGDLDTQEEVDKFTVAAKILFENNIRVYGYSAAQDLDFTELKKFATINGQGFMLTNQINVVEEFSGTPGNIKCIGSCHECSACANAKGKIIEIKKH